MAGECIEAGPGFASNGGKRLTEQQGAAIGPIIDPGYKLMGDVAGKRVGERGRR